MAGVVSLTDKGDRVEPSAELTVILQLHPCVERVKKTRCRYSIYLRRVFKSTVVIVILKTVGKGYDVNLRAGGSTVITGGGGITEIVAVFYNRITQYIADYAAGYACFTANTKQWGVGNTVFDSRVVNSACNSAGFGFRLYTYVGPAILYRTAVGFADDAAAVKFGEHSAYNAEVFDSRTSDSAEQSDIIAFFIIDVKTVDGVAAAVKAAVKDIRY